MSVLVERVIEGVGIYTEGLDRLEGSPERVSNYMGRQLRQLCLNIHDPSTVRDALRSHQFVGVDRLELNYYEGCAFPGMAWGLQLATLQPKQLYVRGLDESMSEWQYLCLWDTCRCLYQTRINDIDPPANLQPGVTISGIWDEWYRVFDDGGIVVPAFYIHLIPRNVTRLIVDFEESVRVPVIPETVDDLTLWGVPNRWNDILKVVSGLNLKKLTLAGSRLVVGYRERQALEARLPGCELCAWPNRPI